MIDYKTWELETVSKNQQVYVDQCNKLHKALLDQGITDTTWEYTKYNIFSLASSSEAFWFLWKNVQACVREYLGTDQPAWMTGWLNYHDNDNLLDWHNHLGSNHHGYISIDPKETKTLFKKPFENYEIENKTGLMYLGPSARLHKVESLSKFTGTRITIAFDVSIQKDVFNAGTQQYNWIPVY
tara:strand:- start:860 stop:1408 length:549 start_codon:yes stop_codon:yes gene_type:complete